jgi:hypothetical protein
MHKFVFTFVVLALFSAGAAQTTYARNDKAAQKYSMPAPPSIDAVKANNKIAPDFSRPTSLERPTRKSAPCDSHMGGCYNQENHY